MVSDMSHVEIEKALILFEDGTLEWPEQHEELQFSYRHSILQKDRPGVCVEAVLRLKKGTKDDIVAVHAEK